jgi:hypothetical protein
MPVDAEAERLAAEETAQAGIFPLTFRRLSGDAISDAELSEPGDYELIDLDMFDGSQHQGEAGKAGKSSQKLAEEILTLLQKGFGETTSKHLQVLGEREGSEHICNHLGYLGITRAVIEDSTLDADQQKKLIGLLGESSLSAAPPPGRRLAVRRSKAHKKTACKTLENLIKELDTLTAELEDPAKGSISVLDELRVKSLIDDIEQTGPGNYTDRLADINGYITTINNIMKPSSGGGKRARRARSTRRTKRKSRGRAGKATRVRRNNNNNAKTKRNKGKKRRTKRA